uniref:helix-turn-helix domain-containing protein n=1 Tax=Mesorhizobium sp. LHD-90 TaxID=3071414 RepID=UPI0035A94B9D
MKPPLLTPAEAAKYLSVCPKHLKLLADAGQIAWVNIALDQLRPVRRYRSEDLEAFIEERRQRTCRYTENTANQNSTMTLPFKVVDFQSPPARAIGAKRHA